MMQIHYLTCYTTVYKCYLHLLSFLLFYFNKLNTIYKICFRDIDSGLPSTDHKKDRKLNTRL